MVQKGVLAPTKVTRSALQTAASVAGLMITPDAMVAELPKEEKEAGTPGGMGGMGGMEGMMYSSTIDGVMRRPRRENGGVFLFWDRKNQRPKRVPSSSSTRLRPRPGGAGLAGAAGVAAGAAGSFWGGGATARSAAPASPRASRLMRRRRVFCESALRSASSSVILPAL